MKKPRRKKGQLSPEDHELWSRVTSTLIPMHPKQIGQTHSRNSKNEDEADQLERSMLAERPTQTALRPPSAAQRIPEPPPLHKMEHRVRKKLVRGSRAIDARIDLHGLTQNQAHERLRHFIHRSQAAGHKIVLVITGKGSGSGGGTGHWDERGVLRRVVPQWLAMPDMRSVVIGYEEAHLSHGGAGALYVRIRRRR